VIGQIVVGQSVVGQSVVGQNVVGQNVIGQIVVRQIVVGQIVVGQIVVGQIVVGQKEIRQKTCFLILLSRADQTVVVPFLHRMHHKFYRDVMRCYKEHFFCTERRSKLLRKKSC
jgi:hypothetical protein